MEYTILAVGILFWFGGAVAAYCLGKKHGLRLGVEALDRFADAVRKSHSDAS